ncbi:uncharacterized protein [Lepeophtheirus salmonis]|uniref:Uncharacterized protein n=1 Tax=Lepeophtheirus salmonis TaxID=72036 RepID=A0A0K2VD87_LEPSM|nr:shootin-1-like isoform X1 [Lepeophtheirus salmonis]
MSNRTTSDPNMNRLSGLEKRMRKIEKNEDKAVKILNKQKKELLKAIDENEKIIQQKLAKTAPAEIKLELELEKLNKRVDVVKEELEKIRSKKQDEVMPLHIRSCDLQDKLRSLDNQLNNMSTSSYSKSQLDLNILTDKTGDINLESSYPPSPPYNPDYPPPYPE